MGKIAFVFPGQGSQGIGMGQEFYEKYSAAKAVFDIADQQLGFSVSELCFEDSKERLSNTAYTQPALLTASMACFAVLIEKGVRADYLAGHSLGEYTSLVASGAIKLDDGVKLVHQRGVIMNEAVLPGQGAMAAVLGLDYLAIDKVCTELTKDGNTVEIANLNCPGQIVISGSKKGIELASHLLKEEGAKKVVILQVSGPFHSSLMEEASTRLAKILDSLDMHPVSVPLITNVNGNILTDSNEIKKMLVEQIKSPVRWEDCVKNLISLGVTTFIEVGPGKVLSGLIKKIDKSVGVLNVEDEASLDKTLATLEVGE